MPVASVYPKALSQKLSEVPDVTDFAYAAGFHRSPAMGLFGVAFVGWRGGAWRMVRTTRLLPK
jgi:hypothetical protein